MADAIPALSRVLVRSRDMHLCARCLGPAMYGHWHHRKTRSVNDEHRHLSCNGILLCSTCHDWVHSNPFLARADGFIVSKFGPPSCEVPINHRGFGRILLDHIGGYTQIISSEEGATASVETIVPSE